MSIVIAVVRQPLCCISVDSCQTKIFDPNDPSRNQYYNDVNKIHAFGDFLIAECGNPHGFQDYWKVASQLRLKGVGVEYFMDSSRDIISAVGTKWVQRYKRLWPDFSPDQLRIFSRTIAVIAGYSRRRERIMLRAVSDDPGMCGEIEGDGIYVAGGSSATTRGTYKYLRNLLVGSLESQPKGMLDSAVNYLSGRRNMMQSREQILRASVMAAQRAGMLERKHTGARTIGGRIGQMFIENDQPPAVVSYVANV